MNISKIRKLIPYFIIAVICTLFFAKPLLDGDELWNYSYAKNISDGLSPYCDFNMIITPLSAYLSGVFLSVFGKSLFVYRVLGYLLVVAILGTMYHLCNKLSKMPFIAFISVLLVFCLYFPYYIYNYNYLSIFVLLLIFEIELWEQPKTLVKHFAVGTLVGLSVLIKQSTGALVFLANIAVCSYYLMCAKHNKLHIAARAIMGVIPMAIYTLYLVMNQSFDDFWEYAVKGIKSFTHKITPFDLISSSPGSAVFFVFIIAVYGCVIIKIAKKGINAGLLSMIAFNISWTIVVYPLCDTSHLLCLLAPLVPLYSTCVEYKEYKKWEKVVCVSVIALVCVIAIIPSIPLGKRYIVCKLNNYQGIIIDSSINENISVVDDFIKEKEKEGYSVRIVEDIACAYKIPLNTYEKNWDMLLVGNIGDNNIETLLKDDSKCLYLVKKSTSSLNRQNYFEMIEYIKKNYLKVGEVQNFDVYKASN